MKTKITMLLISLALVGCNSSKPLQQSPQAVQARRIESQPSLSGTGLRFSAVVTPDTEIMLSFRIPGYVVSLKQVRGQDGRMRDIAEGDRVAQGAILAQMRANEYEDKVHQAVSQAEATDATVLKAKLDFERAQNLYATDSITKPEFDAARAQYDSTQGQLRGYQAQASEARVSLRDTTLVAPFSGDIVKKSLELGAYVAPGVPTFAVANTDIVKIVVGVPDTLIRTTKLGQPVEVGIDAFPGSTFHASISRISAAADNSTRNFDVEVAIPNRDHVLKAGMIGSLQLATAAGPGTATQSLLVPLSSIVQANDGKYGVFVISGSNIGNIARLRSVQIAAVNGTDIVIANGLTGGEQIITGGANLLKDGQRVEVVQ